FAPPERRCIRSLSHASRRGTLQRGLPFRGSHRRVAPNCQSRAWPPVVVVHLDRLTKVQPSGSAARSEPESLWKALRLDFAAFAYGVIGVCAGRFAKLRWRRTPLL